MKVKTLKDLRGLDRPVCLHEMDTPRYSSDKNEDFAFVLRDDLKQEAIKWIKKIDLQINDIIKEINSEIDGVLTSSHIFARQKQIEWIKHFFNISKEEINGKASDPV